MKQFSTRSMLLIVLGAIVILALGVFVMQKKEVTSEIPVEVVENEEGQENQEENPENLENGEETINTSDWQTYRNEELGFEVKVPKEWEMYKDTSPFPPGIGGEWFIAEPIERVDDGKFRFTVAVFDSIESSEVWFENNVENPGNKYNDSYEIIEDNKEIGNNSFYYLKKVSDNFEHWYIDHAYIVSSGDQIFFIKFLEKAGPENWQYDYSSYLSTFEAFVSSLNFI